MLVTIDGKTVVDDKLGVWQRKPPRLIRDMVKPNAKPEPWMKSLLIVMAESALLEQSISVDIQTRPTGWTIVVEKIDDA